MLRTLVADLEAALTRMSRSDLETPSRSASRTPNDAERLSSWLPYSAWLEDRQVFVNRDGLGFCLELRPQSGADEEMASVLTSLHASAPTGTGLQFHLLASPSIGRRLARYARLRLPDDVVPEFHERGREGRHTGTKNEEGQLARYSFRPTVQAGLPPVLAQTSSLHPQRVCSHYRSPWAPNAAIGPSPIRCAPQECEASAQRSRCRPEPVAEECHGSQGVALCASVRPMASRPSLPALHTHAGYPQPEPSRPRLCAPDT